MSTAPKPEPSRIRTARSISSGILSVVLFALFIFTDLGTVTLFISGLSGITAITLGILGVRTGPDRGIHITAIILGAIGVLLSAGLGLFALLFVGAIAL